MQDGLIVMDVRNEPVIGDTGVTVAYVLERLSSDDTTEKICSDYHLTKEQVHAALLYAETNLSQSKHDETLDSMLKEAAPEDTLDYSLLAENAGYFSTYSCPLELLSR